MERTRYLLQKGHAAMLFAMMVPVLFGVFTLASDGARAIQDKARLNEALEVASLAVSAQDSSDKIIRKNTARDYIKYYFPQAIIDDKDIHVIKTICEPGLLSESCTDISSDQRYFNYQVTGSISQDSWFPGNDAIIGLGEKYKVTSGSSSRKYQSEAVDIVLVADFSASMYDLWDGVQKYKGVIDIIGDIADEVGKYNDTLNSDESKSTIGIVGFDLYTKLSRNSFTANIYCDRYQAGYYNLSYDWVALGPWQVSPDGRCYSGDPSAPAGNILNVSKTLTNLFMPEAAIHSVGWSKNEVSNVSAFETIDLTSNFISLKNNLNLPGKFYVPPGGGSGTSSFTGIIKGAQIAASGKNSRRLIIVLSDGIDSYVQLTGNFTSQLFDAGLCSTIKDHLENLTSADGKNVKATLAVIGFGYDVTAYPLLQKCVGKDNVYSATDRIEIKNKILELITEEIGHLAN